MYQEHKVVDRACRAPDGRGGFSASFSSKNVKFPSLGTQVFSEPLRILSDAEWLPRPLF